MTTSEAKIRANRENAKRSTGPRSVLGKRRASANARRHSLAVAIETIPEFRAEVELFERLLAGDQPSLELREATRRFALAQVDLCRIRRARHEASRAMVENLEEWVNQTAPEFHYRRPADKALPMVVLAERPGRAEGTNNPLPELAAWSRTIDRLDRYERRALSRRKAAARVVLDLEQWSGRDKQKIKPHDR